jgi:hypothetical protein
MSLAISTTNKLAGQELVEAFVEDFKEYLMKTPTRSITATKQVIVETIVRESPRLQHCNIDHLRQQLQMALGAPCRHHLGLRFQQIKNELDVVVGLKVVLV